MAGVLQFPITVTIASCTNLHVTDKKLSEAAGNNMPKHCTHHQHTPNSSKPTQNTDQSLPLHTKAHMLTSPSLRTRASIDLDNDIGSNPVHSSPLRSFTAPIGTQQRTS